MALDQMPYYNGADLDPNCATNLNYEFAKSIELDQMMRKFELTMHIVRN